MIKDNIDKLKQELSSGKEIVIVTHRNPDGDAIGSSLGLWNFLLKTGKKATVITPNDYPDFLKWMPGNDTIVKFDSQSQKAKEIVSKAGIIFCLDFGTLKRIEQLGEEVQKSKAFKILVDHHVQPDSFADFMFHDVTACSTAQLIYELIAELGEKNKIDKDSAICLYTGIMTDTLSFKISTVQAKTHIITSELIKAGAVPHIANENVYNANSEDSLKLLGYSLNEKMKVLKEFNAAYISLSADELKKFNYKQGDTEGLVNHPLSVTGVKFSVFFMERDGMIKLSLRSKGNFDVNKVARAHFNGGGHVNASGGELKTSLDDAVKLFLSVLPSYKSELLK